MGGIFRVNFILQKLVLRLSVSEDFVIPAGGILIGLQYQCVTDSRTDCPSVVVLGQYGCTINHLLDSSN